MITIPYENVFFEKLKRGINIFAGAGFSSLPSADGKVLPVSVDLAEEISRKFGIPYNKDVSLEVVGTKVKRLNKQGFDKYLREKYHVNEPNALYDVINVLNITSFITTNIDDLFYAITEKAPNKYVNSIIRGMSKGVGRAVNYIPLHGDITDADSQLYFGKFELAKAAADNNRLFTVMQSELIKHPTLFWGYGFHDSSVMDSIAPIMEERRDSIWIQLRQSDYESIELFESLGYNIIVADTRELLETISQKIRAEDHSVLLSQVSAYSIWDKYNIPTLNNLETNIEADAYLREGVMGWNVVYSKYPYTSKYVMESYDKFLNGKHKLIIIGTPQSGKTTLLRQLAITIDTHCYYIEELSVMEAKKLVKALGDEKITVLFDDCADDMEAFSVLAEEARINIIGTADEYAYEAAKHLIHDVDYQYYYMGDLEKEEANMAFEHISPSIRNKQFRYSRRQNEKYSYWEFCIDNIRGVINEDKVKRFLASISDQETIDVIFLTAYLAGNGSYLSTDVLWYYFQLRNYTQCRKIIEKANEALISIEADMVPDLENQDYFMLRSSIFYRLVSKVAQIEYKGGFARVIAHFIRSVPRGVIPRYYVFRRSAYDAGFFFKLFGRNKEMIYDEVFSYDSSPYTLQQKALYLSKCHRFEEAFLLIDKASMEMPNNFSIQNTKAIITFEANKDSSEEAARLQLDKSMGILEKCYKKDKRKVFHAQKFAEYALFLLKKYDDTSYIETALEWISYIVDEGGASSRSKMLAANLRKEACVANSNKCQGVCRDIGD